MIGGMEKQYYYYGGAIIMIRLFMPLSFMLLMQIWLKYKESSTFVTELTSTRESSSSHVPLTGLGVPMIGAIESSDTTPSSEGPISSMVIKSSSAVITSSSTIAKGASLPPLGDKGPSKFRKKTPEAISNTVQIVSDPPF